MRLPGALFIVLMLMICASLVFAEDLTFEKALRAYLRKDYNTAARHLREYTAHTPDAAAFYLLGYSTYMLKRKTARLKGRHQSGDNEADEYFRQAYLIDPDFSPAAVDFSRYKGR